MNLNQEIETQLINLIDSWLSEEKTNCLSFDGEYTILWDNVFFISTSKIDPLSLLLWDTNPERCLNGDDNITTATIAKLLNKSPAWIQSFQNGWSGQKNKSTSISAYLLGVKLRKRYKK
jgi:hypothetical protein